VYSFAEDPTGTVWVGTAEGVLQLHGDKLMPPPAPLESVLQPVYCIVRTQDRTLWLGTDRGVVAWQGDSLRSLGVRDGLAGWDVNRDACLEDSSGRLRFGTELGLSEYRR